MYLNGAVNHAQRHIRHSNFDLRNCIASRFIAYRIHEVSRLEGQQSAHLNLNAAVSDHVIVTAKLSQRLAEGHATYGAFAEKL